MKGKAAITAETALQLERVLGIPASFWNNLERNYQEFVARQQEEELLRESMGWLKEVPVTTLEKYGWIERRSRKLDKVREVLGARRSGDPLCSVREEPLPVCSRCCPRSHR